MKRIANISICVILFFALTAAPLWPVSAQDAPPPQIVSSLDLGYPPVELRLDPAYSSFIQAPPPLPFLLSAQAENASADAEFGSPNSEENFASAAFVIDYVADGQINKFGDFCTTFPEAAKPPFEFAASIWAGLVRTSVPVHIEACWSDMGAGILGHSGAVNNIRDFTNAPVANTYYAVSLANALAGTDLNGANPEMSIAYNSDYLNDFYYGTDTNTGWNQVNFATVVLHEIAHGLGFSGSMRSISGSGSWGINGSPKIYDRFAVDGAGIALTNPASYPNPSPALGSALTSGSVYFDGPNARLANGGASVRLYAPSDWNPGSSFAHLDYNTFASTANRLMVYAVSRGTTNHNPGPVTMGILADVGWVRTTPPTNINLTASSIAENQPANTLIGVLSTTHPDASATLTYSLVSTPACPGTGNAAFTIQGSSLRTSAPLNYEAQSSYSICIRTTDPDALTFDKSFTIAVTNLNEGADQIGISPSILRVNAVPGAIVGSLYANDPEGDPLTFSLTEGFSDIDQFAFDGATLTLAQPVTRTAGETYTLQATVRDSAGLGTTQTITITVVGENAHFLPIISN